MQQTRVTLLPLLHARVTTHVPVPLPETDGGLGSQTLHDGRLTAVGEQLEDTNNNVIRAIINHIRVIIIHAPVAM